MQPPWQDHKLWQNPISSIDSDGGLALFKRVLNPARTAGDDTASLELNPHPGSIGEGVSGAIRLPQNTGVSTTCVIRLRCISHYESGPGDYSDSGSEVLWEKELQATPTRTRDSLTIAFAFDQLPDNLPESELPVTGSYIDWQITLSASADDAKLRHTFSIPVFATDLYGPVPARSRSETEALLSEWRLQKTWQPYRVDFEIDRDTLIVRLGPWRGGFYQTGGFKGLFAFFLLLGLSVLLLVSANDNLVSAVVTGVFGTLGLFVTGLAGYLLLRTVEIRVQPRRLSRRWQIFGHTVQSRIVPVEDIVTFEIRYGGLYVVSGKFGELELIDSIHDPKLLRAFRRLIVVSLDPAQQTGTRRRATDDP